ncbi:hypothetical protein MKSMC1_34620 [Mycobacterium kansasii]|uniref:Uncharacterized protein n=1 Tax=Mycobacterium kansasii ATCC 12478 TaxID=557599 RepID=U5X0T3_MYCKA|nr:hypothetical protein MKAN_02100 [Mycobacterium kansasii ATCC 12478]KEP41394.1 hypothetical protein MKSMC1_34620 [Mycobacterium kansasii]
MMSISHRRRWLVCLAALTAAIFASGVCSSMYPFGNDPDHPERSLADEHAMDQVVK